MAKSQTWLRHVQHVMDEIKERIREELMREMHPFSDKQKKEFLIFFILHYVPPGQIINWAKTNWRAPVSLFLL